MATWASLFPALARRTHVMGILNVTPDSFSDGGRFATLEAALRHARQMKAEGADLLDVGAESTRPGAEPVPAEEERRRLLPVVDALIAEGLGPLSIDTTKASVAAELLDRGAAVVNDVSAGADPAMFGVVAARRAPMVLMHLRAPPREMQVGTWSYPGGVVEAVRGWLAARLAAAEAAGVEPAALALDPGLGFGKTVDENLELIAGLPRLAALGRPLVLGPARKRFLGALTGREVDARGPATLAAVALGIAHGAAVVRVHEVAAAVDAAKVADALRGLRA